MISPWWPRGRLHKLGLIVGTVRAAIAYNEITHVLHFIVIFKMNQSGQGILGCLEIRGHEMMGVGKFWVLRCLVNMLLIGWIMDLMMKIISILLNDILLYFLNLTLLTFSMSIAKPKPIRRLRLRVPINQQLRVICLL